MVELEILDRKARDEDDAEYDQIFRKKLNDLLWNSSSGYWTRGSKAETRKEFEKRSMVLLRNLIQTKLNAMIAGTGTAEDDGNVIYNDSNNNDNKANLYTAMYRKTQKELAIKALNQII